MSTPLFSTDSEGRISFLDPRIASVLGIPAGQLPGRRLIDYEPEALEGGTNQAFDFGSPASQNALEASELRYRRLFESAKDGILILDGATGSIIDANPFLLALLGTPFETLLGKQLWDLGFPSDISPNHAKFLELQQREYVRYEDLPLKTASGKQVDVEFVSNAYWVGGRSIIQCNIRDISERKRNQAELTLYHENLEALVRQRTEELDRSKQIAVSANEAKSRFVSSVSHEIRTPLNAILGFSQLMMREPAISPVHQGYLETINRSGEHLLALVNEILDFSKLEAGRATLQSSPFRLLDLLDELTSLFQERVKGLGLVLSVHLSPEVPELVSTDEAKLRQILVNLIGNAITFTPKGSIDIRVRSRAQAEQSFLEIEVQDTGFGFSPEDLQKVFHPFEQTSQGQHSRGTGLGLVLSRQYAQLLGGDITLVSHEGEGSCFTVTVQVARGDSPPMAPPHSLRRVRSIQANSPSSRILVVDDEPDNRTLLKELLGMVGFEVRLAVDGKVAVEEFIAWSPHLILMDVKMPVLGGQEAIAQIRALEGGGRVRIIAVTASAFAEDREQAHDWGADGYLRKPFLENELFDCIRNQLGTQYEYGGIKKNSVEDSPQ